MKVETTALKTARLSVRNSFCQMTKCSNECLKRFINTHNLLDCLIRSTPTHGSDSKSVHSAVNPSL